jgi:hypothetical protein
VKYLIIRIALLLYITGTASARVDITTVAAGTTIGVNLLEIKEHITAMKKAVKATKKVVVKAAKKVGGK